MKIIKLPLVLLALAASTAGLVGFASGRTTADRTVNVTAAQLQNSFVGVFKKVSPSVVQIRTSEGLGSGIVFDAKGHIVTNYHVVGTAKTFTVTTYAPTKRLTAKLVGSFPADDLAVIKVESSSL